MVLPEGAVPTKTVRVPHLNGTTVAYHLAGKISSNKPTLIMINSGFTCATLFRPQFNDSVLLEGMNLLAVEPLGHGGTRAGTPAFTPWDSAFAFIQLMDSLAIKRAFVLGISQGGFIGARMALYAPDRVSHTLSLSQCPFPPKL